MIIKTDDFAGICPIIANFRLGQNQAQRAYNCKFINGNLQPWRNTGPAAQAIPLNTKSIFLYHRDKWITSIHDDDIVLGPIIGDSEDRIYKTSDNTYPEMSTRTQIDLDNWFKLGVPTPETGPTLSDLSEVLTGTITQVMSTSEYNEDPAGDGDATTGAGPLVAFSEGHGLEDGQRVTIEMPIGLTFLDGQVFSVTVLDADHFTLGGTTPYAGYAFEAAGSWTVYRDESEKESRAYAFTYVTDYGEEGPPSPLTTIEVYGDAAVEVSGLADYAGGADHAFLTAALKRIYRSVTSTSGTQLYLVGEILFGIFTFTDDIEPTSIGEPLPSESWDIPPADLAGLVTMPNGILAGFSGRDICFSVSFMPHAWPIEWRLPVDSDIVALGVYGQSMVVATKGRPYVVVGVDPSAMTLEKLEINQSCVAKRGMVDMGYSVIYPSPDGLVEVRQGSVQLITRAVFSRDQWQALNPEEINAFFWEGRYAFYTDSIGYVFVPAAPTLAELDGGVSAGFSDLEEDEFYFASQSSQDLFKIEGWLAGDAGDEYTEYEWKSKLFRLPKPGNFSCAQVFRADVGDVTFKLYADGVLKHTQVVTDSEPFRLPGGFLATDWEYVLSGDAEVHAVYVSNSITELRQV